MAVFIRLCLFSLVFLVPSAFACSVCSGGQTQEVQDAYIYITILLSIVPLIAITLFVVVWKKKQKAVRKLEELEERLNLNQTLPNDEDSKNA